MPLSGVYFSLVSWLYPRRYLIVCLLVWIYFGISVSLPQLEFEPIVIHLHGSLIGLYVFWLFGSSFLVRDPKPFGKIEYGFKKKWLSVKEIPRYVKILVLLMPTSLVQPKSFSHITHKIIKMWKCTGTRFTIYYWAEVYRVTLLFINSGGIKDPKFCPKLTKRGIPKVFPVEVRKFLWDFREALKGKPVGSFELQVFTFKLLSSILVFFRACCPTSKVRPSYNSIIGAFTGVSTTLDIDQIIYALASAGLRPLKVKTPRLFRPSSKAGPNGSNAITSMGIDLVAWILHPHLWLIYYRMCRHLRFHSLLIWFVGCSILLAPFALVAKLIDLELVLGRLAILPEARGKMRKIGIVDWWTQTLLKPLHDEIYLQLGRIPQDGTNNQTLPLTQMLLTANWRDPHTSLESLDLSDATDRLPIDVQVQVLNCLGFPGQMWADLLNRDWLTPKGGLIRYAVGQPMGAYSSFAMLALTQHVLMHMALKNSRQVVNPCHLPSSLIPKEIVERHGTRYSILGDDSAADSKVVGYHYTKLLTRLGVVINPIKGFSGNIVEFAKQIFVLYPQVGFATNLSPVGAKNVLLAIRYPLFLSSLIMDMANKNFEPWKFTKFDDLHRLILSLFPGSKLQLYNYGKVPRDHFTLVMALKERRDWVNAVLITCFGPFSGLWQLNKMWDSTPLSFWAEGIFLYSLRKLGVRLESNQIFILMKHYLIRSSKRPSWVKNLKRFFVGETLKEHWWNLLGRPLNMRLYGLRLLNNLLEPFIAFGIKLSSNPLQRSGLVSEDFKHSLWLYVMVPNKVAVHVLLLSEGIIMTSAAILSLQWVIVFTDLFKKFTKQVKISLLWLISDLFRGDFAKVGFQGYARDDPVKYVKSTQIYSSRDPVVKYTVTTKGGPIKYTSIFGDTAEWGALKFSYFVSLLLSFEPVENLATKSFRDYRSETLSSAFIKMLLMFKDHSDKIKRLHWGTTKARDELRAHLRKSKGAMPKKLNTRVYLLAAPSRRPKSKSK